MNKISVGILGASGYTGLELLRLLGHHPAVRLQTVSSRQYEGRQVRSIVPNLPPEIGQLRFVKPESEHFADCDAVFCAAPAGVAAAQMPALVDGQARIFDLSADFRLKDAQIWEAWYGLPHPCPELLPEAVYGLPELQPQEWPQARIVAVPGCYPTAVLLATAPLLRAGILQQPILADCASGVSGAGREAKVDNLFVEVAENYRAYAVRGHRHLPEMLEQMRAIPGVGTSSVELVFVPHLVPMTRGLFATVHAGGDADAAQQALRAAYSDTPLVRVTADGEEISTAQVRGTNACLLAVHRPPQSKDRMIVQAVIDNLGKGAAGQAVQCFNLAFAEELGLQETTGLA